MKIATFEFSEEKREYCVIGDVVDQEFRLLEFTYDSVVFAYTDDKWKGQTTKLRQQGLE